MRTNLSFTVTALVLMVWLFGSLFLLPQSVSAQQVSVVSGPLPQGLEWWDVSMEEGDYIDIDEGESPNFQVELRNTGSGNVDRNNLGAQFELRFWSDNGSNLPANISRVGNVFPESWVFDGNNEREFQIRVDGAEPDWGSQGGVTSFDIAAGETVVLSISENDIGKILAEAYLLCRLGGAWSNSADCLNHESDPQVTLLPLPRGTYEYRFQLNSYGDQQYTPWIEWHTGQFSEPYWNVEDASYSEDASIPPLRDGNEGEHYVYYMTSDDTVDLRWSQTFTTPFLDCIATDQSFSIGSNGVSTDHWGLLDDVTAPPPGESRTYGIECTSDRLGRSDKVATASVTLENTDSDDPDDDDETDPAASCSLSIDGDSTPNVDADTSFTIDAAITNGVELDGYSGQWTRETSPGNHTVISGATVFTSSDTVAPKTISGGASSDETYGLLLSGHPTKGNTFCTVDVTVAASEPDPETSMSCSAAAVSPNPSVEGESVVFTNTMFNSPMAGSVNGEVQIDWGSNDAANPDVTAARSTSFYGGGAMSYTISGATEGTHRVRYVAQPLNESEINCPWQTFTVGSGDIVSTLEYEINGSGSWQNAINQIIDIDPGDEVRLRMEPTPTSISGNTVRCDYPYNGGTGSGISEPNTGETKTIVADCYEQGNISNRSPKYETTIRTSGDPFDIDREYSINGGPWIGSGWQIDYELGDNVRLRLTGLNIEPGSCVERPVSNGRYDHLADSSLTPSWEDLVEGEDFNTPQVLDITHLLPPTGRDPSINQGAVWYGSASLQQTATDFTVRCYNDAAPSQYVDKTTRFFGVSPTPVPSVSLRGVSETGERSSGGELEIETLTTNDPDEFGDTCENDWPEREISNGCVELNRPELVDLTVTARNVTSCEPVNFLGDTTQAVGSSPQQLRDQIGGPDAGDNLIVQIECTGPYGSAYDHLVIYNDQNSWEINPPEGLEFTACRPDGTTCVTSLAGQNRTLSTGAAEDIDFSWIADSYPNVDHCEGGGDFGSFTDPGRSGSRTETSPDDADPTDEYWIECFDSPSGGLSTGRAYITLQYDDGSGGNSGNLEYRVNTGGGWTTVPEGGSRNVDISTSDDVHLQWNTSGYSSCELTETGNATPLSTLLDGVLDQDGDITEPTAGNTKTFSLTCDSVDIGDVIVNTAGGAPSVTIEACEVGGANCDTGSVSFPEGTEVEITWDANDPAASCTAQSPTYNFSTGGNDSGTDDTVDEPAVGDSNTFTVACDVGGGLPGVAAVEVSITGGTSCDVTLSGPDVVQAGESAELIWGAIDSTCAASCVLTQNGVVQTGIDFANETYYDPELFNDTTFELDCGGVADTKTIRVRTTFEEV